MFTPKQEHFLPKLQTLIDNSYKEQWSPVDKINWSENLVLPDGIPSATYIDMVSQLYYAEEATIQILARLMQDVPDFQAKQYLCTQSIDEARHAQVYRKYLEKLGDVAPINEGLRLVLENGIHWKGTFCGTIVALNVVMEGEALNQQNKRIQTLPCPLFKNINSAIIRDEARHSAFGRIYMKEKLQAVGIEEKDAIYTWIKELWKLWGKANEGRYSIDNAELLRTEKNELGNRWIYQEKIFADIGLRKAN